MRSSSLFGHLVTRFNSHPENIATEALSFVLNHSSIAKSAFLRYLSQIQPGLPETLIFKAQVGDDDGAIPDLVGIAEEKQVLLVEAKFWAGLTPNQPVTYLRRLPSCTNSCVLVIAPAKRFPTLWNELVTRCKAADFPLGDERRVGSEILVRGIGERHSLAIVSWRSVLGFILTILEAEGETSGASDIRQLCGLCEKMDEDAFLPITSEELTSSTGTRIVQYCSLVDEATTQAVAEGFAAISGMKATGGFGWYGRYMRIHGNGCCLFFGANNWSRLRSTPLWLSVKDRNWKLTSALKDLLLPLETDDPPRLIIGETQLLVPIALSIGVERDQVMSNILTQLREVANLLKRSEDVDSSLVVPD
jgi:hypothetical protein